MAAASSKLSKTVRKSSSAFFNLAAGLFLAHIEVYPLLRSFVPVQLIWVSLYKPKQEIRKRWSIAHYFPFNLTPGRPPFVNSTPGGFDGGSNRPKS